MKDTPAQRMESERRQIDAVLRLLDSMASNLELGMRPNVSLLQTGVEFLRIYADRLHHGKAEALFFPLVCRRGASSAACDLGRLTQAHEQSRSLLRCLDEQIVAYRRNRAGSEKALLVTLRQLCRMCQEDIGMEAALVPTLAQQYLSEADQRELSRKFAWRDEAIGRDVVARMEAFSSFAAQA